MRQVHTSVKHFRVEGQLESSSSCSFRRVSPWMTVTRSSRGVKAVSGYASGRITGIVMYTVPGCSSTSPRRSTCRPVRGNPGLFVSASRTHDGHRDGLSQWCAAHCSCLRAPRAAGFQGPVHRHKARVVFGAVHRDKAGPCQLDMGGGDPVHWDSIGGRMAPRIRCNRACVWSTRTLVTTH